MRIIDVTPLADGWAVQSDQFDNHLVFSSGRAAEQAALRLADRLARAGMPSEIRIHLRDGALGGCYFRPVSGARRSGPVIAAGETARSLEPA